MRELQNAVTHGSVLSGKEDVDAVHLPDEIVNPPPLAPNGKGSLRTLVEVEREHVRRVLELSGGHQLDTARILGISRTTLWRKLKELGIEVSE